MYSDIDFEKTFIKYNFDNELIEMDNELVNSNKIYLDIKNNYLKTSKKNFIEFQKLYNEYDLLSNNYLVTSDNNTTSHVFTVVNTNILENINSKIKNLLKEQQYIYDNFIHYISFINSSAIVTPTKYQEEINQPLTIKIKTNFA